MSKLVTKDNRINFGCFDGPINFNNDDFRLTTLFGGKKSSVGRKFAAGAFNFVVIASDEYCIGIGAVQLGYLANIFGFLYEYDKGMKCDFARLILPSSLKFPLNPDESEIEYTSRGVSYSVKKSHKKNTLDIDCRFKNLLSIKAKCSYGFKNKPLRVLNPSCGDPTRFTFTEKCPLIKPLSLSVNVNGSLYETSLKRTTIFYDWSAGFFNRYTHWFWSAFSGEIKGNRVGANFAAMVNETFYPENAYWINGKRIRTAQVIFDFDMNDPYRTSWRIFTEDGRVNLTFVPFGERSKKVNVHFVKLFFRQFLGVYSGTLKDASGKKIRIDGIKGVSEIHLSKW
jgi:hypothetical protein